MPRAKFAVETGEVRERALLVGVDRGDKDWPLEESLAELERLADTAGADTVCTLSQRLDAPNPRTFIGQGKAEEVARLVAELEIDVVIFDDELSPSQQANLEKLVGKPVKVIDRTALILDIFALHATSKEGSLQVKLAQNQYLYPRLRGMWSHLAANRMGGGVGSRFGEGESQLEVDRRLVRKRISRIRRELADLASSRRTQRARRNAGNVFRVALAGYTNAGKSSLMNRLTGETLLSYDKLFATLDSTTRQLTLPGKVNATLTDTVGFIQKLPHNLVEAFRSTLDEIREADLVLVVADAASAQCDAQIASVREVLGQIEACDIPSLLVYNKIDLLTDVERQHLADLHPDALLVSAKEAAGIEELVGAIEEEAFALSPLMQVCIPYDKGSLVEKAHRECVIVDEGYTAEGTCLSMRVPPAFIDVFRAYESA